VRVRTVVITRPEAIVSEVAKRLIDNDINALPVVDDDGRVVGVISEALAELPLRGAWSRRLTAAHEDGLDARLVKNLANLFREFGRSIRLLKPSAYAEPLSGDSRLGIAGRE
jgi:CBS-domain-containing membrane protein